MNTGAGRVVVRPATALPDGFERAVSDDRHDAVVAALADDPGIVGYEGGYPVRLAAERGATRCLTVLLDAGGDPDAQRGSPLRSTNHLTDAATTAVIDILVAHGASLGEVDGHPSALACALGDVHLPAMMALRRHGAVLPTVRRGVGDAPLGHAMQAIAGALSRPERAVDVLTWLRTSDTLACRARILVDLAERTPGDTYEDGRVEAGLAGWIVGTPVADDRRSMALLHPRMERVIDRIHPSVHGHTGLHCLALFAALDAGDDVAAGRHAARIAGMPAIDAGSAAAIDGWSGHLAARMMDPDALRILAVAGPLFER